VSQGIGSKARSGGFTVNSLLRSVGRIAIWTTVALLLIRGLGAVLAKPQESAPDLAQESAPADRASDAFAVRFARTYLSDPSPRALSPFLAEGARVGWGLAPVGHGSAVAQAEVTAVKQLGGGRAVLTVACELRDARTLYLAVPISRSGAGEVAVLGAPWIVAAPSVAGVAAERPRPIAGPDGAAIGALVAKFLPAYVSARSPDGLSYLLAPGAAIVPLAGSLELLGVPGAAAQLGDGEGRRRSVVVAARLRDPGSGAVYRLAYRLALVKRERWYVEAVEGTLP
jgi:Conjugative transposon protein TcpC